MAIAHRLSTVRNADQIVVLDHGRIIERGTHRELQGAGGKYQSLLGALHYDVEPVSHVAWSAARSRMTAKKVSTAATKNNARLQGDPVQHPEADRGRNEERRKPARPRHGSGLRVDPHRVVRGVDQAEQLTQPTRRAGTSLHGHHCARAGDEGAGPTTTGGSGRTGRTHCSRGQNLDQPPSVTIFVRGRTTDRLRSYVVLGVPTSAGAHHAGQELAPAALRAHGLRTPPAGGRPGRDRRRRCGRRGVPA